RLKTLTISPDSWATTRPRWRLSSSTSSHCTAGRKKPIPRPLLLPFNSLFHQLPLSSTGQQLNSSTVQQFNRSTVHHKTLRAYRRKSRPKRPTSPVHHKRLPS